MQPENDGRTRRLLIIAAALVVVLAAAVTAWAIRSAREPGQPETLGLNTGPALIQAAASAPETASAPARSAEPEPSVGPVLEDIYIIRAYEGYIAVFRPGSAKPESVTDTRVSSLRRADQILLREGVTLQGREALARFLEDFSY